MKNQTRAIIKDAVKPFLFAMLFAIIFTKIILFVYNKAEMQTKMEIEQYSIQMPITEIKNDFRDIASDAFILANLNKIKNLWKGDKSIDEEFLSELAEYFLSISKIKEKYDQVRLIDTNGLETIRINFNNGKPYIVPKEKLQNKKGRYYFDDTFSLQKNEIYISPLDLNIENGVVEQPLKPMIRVGTPFINESGEKSGIVLLNYFAEELIQQFKSYQNPTKIDNLILLNSDGYWLCGANPDDEWGFMFDEKKDRTFSNKYPKVWKEIHSQKSGQFQTEAGLFTFETIFPLSESQISSTGSGKAFSPSLSKANSIEYYWKIVSFLPTSYLRSNSNKRRLIGINALIVLAVLFFVVSILFSNFRVHKKNAEEKLKASEEKFKSIFENLIDVYYKADKDGKIVQASPSAVTTFGYSSMDDLIGKQISTFYKNQEQRNKFLTLLKKQKKVIAFQAVLLKGDGSEIYIETTASIVYDKNGNYDGVEGIVRDITERKQTENLLVASEAHYKQLFNLLPFGGEVIDTKGKIIDCSINTAKMLGYEIDEIIGKQITKFVDENTLKTFKKYFSKLINGETFSLEGTFVHKNGDKINVLRSACPIRNGGNEVTGALIISTDITDLKKAEEALSQFKKIVESTSGHMAFVDTNYVYVEVNNSYTKAHNRKRKEIVGYTIAEIMGDEVFKSVIKEKIDACISGKSINYEKWFDFNGIGRRYMEVSYYPYFNEDNQISGVIVDSHDITDRKKAEEKLISEKKMNELLLNSMPYPIMLINKKRKVLAANKIALDVGVILGDYCWKEFGKSACLSEKNKLLSERNQNDSRIQCTFCKMDKMFQNNEITNDPAVEAFGRIWDTYWVPLNDNEYLHYSIDVTERKENERKLEKYAEIQEILFREVNHRVKNNLSAIIGLIRKEQDSAVTNGSFDVHIFDDLVGRIYGLSEVHSLLSQSEWQPIQLNHLCEKILRGRLNNLALNKRIEIDIKPKNANVLINSSQAHQLALVLNELGTNSMKYAVLNRETAKITVILEQINKQISIIFSDDGPGFPQEILDGNTEHLGIGFNIINGIIRHTLAGNVKHENQNGAKTIITFKSELLDKDWRKIEKK